MQADRPGTEAARERATQAQPPSAEWVETGQGGE